MQALLSPPVLRVSHAGHIPIKLRILRKKLSHSVYEDLFRPQNQNNQGTIRSFSPYRSPFVGSVLSIDAKYFVAASLNRRTAVPLLAELAGDTYLNEEWSSLDEDVHTGQSGRNGTLGIQLDGFFVKIEMLSIAVFLAGLAWVTVKQFLSTKTLQLRWSPQSNWLLLPLGFFLFSSFLLRIRLSRFAKIAQGSQNDYTPSHSNRNLTTKRLDFLENDLADTVKIVRSLSRQLEKLSVRFRVNKRTLRDPILEATELANKTSQAVELLSSKATAVDEELRQTQMVMMAMQEQSAKQLRLFSEALTQSKDTQVEMMKRISVLEKESSLARSRKELRLRRKTNQDQGKGQSPKLNDDRKGKKAMASPEAKTAKESGQFGSGSSFMAAVDELPFDFAKADFWRSAEPAMAAPEPAEEASADGLPSAGRDAVAAEKARLREIVMKSTSKAVGASDSLERGISGSAENGGTAAEGEEQ